MPRWTPCPGTMRTVNIAQYEIILKGKEWLKPYSPCSKEAIKDLESNEAYVTWLVPKHDTKLSGHVPVPPA